MAATLPDGLRLGHLAVLGALADRSGQSQRELSEALAIHATDVVAIIDDLFERDLVTREVDQEDRRRRLIRITKRGRLLVTRATTDSGHVTAQLLKNLKPLEQETLVELLRRALET
jgi:DNA-binding MarR family transcriptional regulator